MFRPRFLFFVYQFWCKSLKNNQSYILKIILVRNKFKYWTTIKIFFLLSISCIFYLKLCLFVMQWYNVVIQEASPMRKDLVATSDRVHESLTPAMRATWAEVPSPAKQTHSGALDPDVTVSKRRSIFPDLEFHACIHVQNLKISFVY